MIQIFETQSGRSLGTLTEEQLAFLKTKLEKESDEDRDFYLTGATVDILAEDGADASLVALLRTAMAGRDELEFRWEE
ncbi:MAG TPA: galactosyldiacylglycerol synthase [Thermoanaerobaculia bacterium]|nr:galactosyldiacylglycerol synthase [Thermoanaerobaculia bacterium]